MALSLSLYPTRCRTHRPPTPAMRRRPMGALRGHSSKNGRRRGRRDRRPGLQRHMAQGGTTREGRESLRIYPPLRGCRRRVGTNTHTHTHNPRWSSKAEQLADRAQGLSTSTQIRSPKPLAEQGINVGKPGTSPKPRASESQVRCKLMERVFVIGAAEHHHISVDLRRILRRPSFELVSTSCQISTGPMSQMFNSYCRGMR